MTTVATSGGFTIEFVGFVILLWGFRRTWKDLDPEEKFCPTLEALRRTSAKLLRMLRLSRPEPTRGSMGATLPALTAEAYGRVGLVPLPDLSSDPAGFANILSKNLDVLQEQVHRTTVQLSKRVDEVKVEAKRAEERLQRQISSNEKLVRSRTIRGLREQVTGLAFFSVGLLLQAFGSLGVAV